MQEQNNLIQQNMANFFGKPLSENIELSILLFKKNENIEIGLEVFIRDILVNKANINGEVMLSVLAEFNTEDIKSLIEKLKGKNLTDLASKIETSKLDYKNLAFSLKDIHAIRSVSSEINQGKNKIDKSIQNFLEKKFGKFYEQCMLLHNQSHTGLAKMILATVSKVSEENKTRVKVKGKKDEKEILTCQASNLILNYQVSDQLVEIKSSEDNFIFSDFDTHYLLPGNIEIKLNLGQNSETYLFDQVECSNSLLRNMIVGQKSYSVGVSKLKELAGEYAMEQFQKNEAIEQPQGEIKCQLAKDFSDFLLKAMQEVFKSSMDESEKKNKIGDLMLLKFRSDAMAYSGKNIEKLKDIKNDFKELGNEFRKLYNHEELLQSLVGSFAQEKSSFAQEKSSFAQRKIGLKEVAFVLEENQINYVTNLEVAQKLSEVSISDTGIGQKNHWVSINHELLSQREKNVVPHKLGVS